jgi:uncharacterized protein (TIGR03437 family)
MNYHVRSIMCPDRLRLLSILLVFAATASAQSTTSLTASPNSAVYGQPVILTATVTGPGTGGTVDFKEGSATVGTAAVSGGQASLTTTYLIPGAHVITALYSGVPGQSSGSLSNAVTVTISLAPANLSFTASPNPVTYPQTVSLHCFVPPQVGGGTITLTDGATTLQAASNAADVFFGGLLLAPGVHNLACSFSGNSAYKAESVSVTEVVNQPALKPSVTTLSVSPNPAVVRQLIQYAVTVSGSGAAAPTGTVQIYSGSLRVGGTLITNGAGTVSGNLPVGTQALTAVYSGDSLYTGSTSAPVTVLVNPEAPVTTSVAVSSSLNPSEVGQPVTFSATVSAGSGTGVRPTGSIAWKDSGVPLGITALGFSGQANFTSTALASGTRNITADYSGDSNFVASSGNITQVVNPIATATALNVSPAAPTAGAPAVLTATITARTGTPSGAVTFRDGGNALGVATLRSGSATLSWTPAVGAHSLTAAYPGDSTYQTSTSASLAVTVRGAATITVTANPASPVSGQAVTLTAAVTPNGGPAPTGSVTFRDAATVLGLGTLDGSGHASLALASGLAAGDHNIAGTYGGDANYLAAVSTSLTLRISQNPTATTLSESIAAGGITLTSTVTSSSGVPTGSVQFQNTATGQILGGTTLSAGRSTFTFPGAAPVGDPVQAIYAGEGGLSASSSAAIPLVAIVNGFSYAYAAVAPDELLTAFGAGLTPDTVAASSADLPVTLAGLTVTLAAADGAKYAAPLYYVSPNQINFVVPSGTAPGLAQLTIAGPKGAATVAVLVGSAAPALVAAGQAIRVHADGSQDSPILLSSDPLPFGSATDQLYLVLYGTGFRHARDGVTCSVKGNRVDVLYAGTQGGFAALDQINIQLPDALRGAGVVALTCSADGQRSNPLDLSLQ